MKKGKTPSRSITVKNFVETGGGELEMKLAAGGAGLHHHITEAAINRPGLALSGFFEYFARHRIQVLGLAEHTYLSSLTEEERTERLRAVFRCRIPCLVVARNRKVFPEVKQLAEEFKIPVLRTRMITRHFINAATIIMENLMAPRMTVQGTMVEIMGIGVLIEGKAGMGKSETALGLIKRGHALVSDDITALRRDSAGSLIGSPVSVTRYHMEIRGLGIIHVPSLFGVASVREEKKLDLVTTLFLPGTRDAEEDRGGTPCYCELLGVQVPQALIRVVPGRDLSNVVETAALDHKLKRLGHDAAKELDEKLVAHMTGSKAGSE